MKEQDYINIMNRIRKDHIENAMLWDGSAQKDSRSIRRLSLGIGAIAACIAVVIGCIGYSVHREHPANPSGETSGAENKEQLNLFGGHGEIKCTLGNDSSILYSDDEYYYFPTKIGAGQDSATVGGPSPDSFSYLRWEIDGGSVCEPRTYDGILLSDGERLYTYHDGQLFITDSRGNETFFSGVPWKPCRIQKLGDDWYLLSAFLEDSWIDGHPQPYLFLDKPGEGIYQQYGNYGDVRSDGKGDTLYFRSENQIYSAPRKSPNQKTLLADAGDAPDAIADWTVDENNLYYIIVSDDGVQYRRKPLDPDAEEKEWDCFDTSDPEPIRNYYYFNQLKSELFSVTYTYRDDVPEFQVYSTGSPIFPPGISSAMWYRYSVTAAELWGDHLPDPDVRPDMTFFDTDEYIIFTLPQEGMHGEQIVQLQKNTQDCRYLGVNYVQQETKPQETEAQETELADITNAASDLNALGGKGKLRSFRFRNLHLAGIAEDDEYIYDFDLGKRARKTGSDTVFEPLNLPQIPQYDPENQTEAPLSVTDGMVLIQHDNALFEVHPDGTQTAISDSSADDADNPMERNVFTRAEGFAHDASGRPTRIFLRGLRCVDGKPDYEQQVNAILNLETGKCCELPEKEGDWFIGADAVYAQYNSASAGHPVIEALCKFADDGTPIPVSQPDWKFGSFAQVDADGNIWFRDSQSQPCMGNPADGSLTNVSEDELSRNSDVIPGTECSLYQDYEYRIVFRNHADSSEIILSDVLTGGNLERLQPRSIRGSYCENGVIRIALGNYAEIETGSFRDSGLTVFTIDGSEVSSYEITNPA